MSSGSPAPLNRMCLISKASMAAIGTKRTISRTLCEVLVLTQRRLSGSLRPDVRVQLLRVLMPI